MHMLSREFFQRPTLDVAPALLGKTLVWGPKRGIITETEAYIGQDDPACHAARGLTPRNKVMFGPPGHAYVYLIYGLHHCFNVITEPEGYPAGVLVRGVYWHNVPYPQTNGPGKLCRHFGITRVHNGLDMTHSQHFCLLDTPNLTPYKITPRIGIRLGTEKPWRFFITPDRCQKKPCHMFSSSLSRLTSSSA